MWPPGTKRKTSDARPKTTATMSARSRHTATRVRRRQHRRQGTRAGVRDRAVRYAASEMSVF